MDDVDGGFAVAQQQLDRLVDAGQRVLERERHRALGAADVDALPTGAPVQVLLQPVHVAERGGHEQELGVGQFDERDLPRPAPVGLRVVVELVHHHLPDLGARPFAQRDVGDDLGRRADDGGVGVDGGVAGEHADVLGPEHLAQREELLAHERLDGRGVVTALTAGHRGEVGAEGDQGLA